jgi:hypothetical protein
VDNEYISGTRERIRPRAVVNLRNLSEASGGSVPLLKHLVGWLEPWTIWSRPTRRQGLRAVQYPLDHPSRRLTTRETHAGHPRRTKSPGELGFMMAGDPEDVQKVAISAQTRPKRGPPSYKTGTRHVHARYQPRTSLGQDSAPCINSANERWGMFSESAHHRYPPDLRTAGWPSGARASSSARIAPTRTGCSRRNQVAAFQRDGKTARRACDRSTSDMSSSSTSPRRLRR